MATDFDNLVADLERSYEELQTRMADPAVYNDHREATDLGRRQKELEQPNKLAHGGTPSTPPAATPRSGAWSPSSRSARRACRRSCGSRSSRPTPPTTRM